MKLLEALMDVRNGRAQRICVPGKWRVWRKDDEIKFELIGTSHANN